MKHIYIHTAHLSAADYRSVLDRLCPDSVRDITVHTHFPATVTEKDIEALVEVQKAFSEDRSLRFRNYGVFTQLPRFSKALLKALHKHSFFLELQVGTDMAASLVDTAKRLEKAGLGYRLQVNEPADQQAAYRLFAVHGLHISFTNPRYTAQCPDLFDKWLYDPAAQGVNTFTDIIHMLVMQTHSPNCRHASCFGTTFYVDERLDVYLCPVCPDQRTKLGSLKEAENLEALLNCDTVARLLPPAVQKRERCAAGCKSFGYCQGGCPLETENDECVHYAATVERIRQRLLEIYRDGNVRQVNYIVKNAILNALAFGTAFFNQQP